MKIQKSLRTLVLVVLSVVMVGVLPMAEVARAASFWSLIGQVYGSGTGLESQFYNPSDVALDSSGNIFVADQGHHRIQKFSSNGEFVGAWG